MPPTFARNAIVLGLLSAIGPFAIDMYLPALPAISADLRASTSATQATLMVFFVAFGICQIAYGPVSDMFGRKPPLYAGLGLFVAGSIGCIFCPTIGWLIGFRFIQGVGASAVMVIPRAVIRDLHTGLEATRLMALVMLVFSVSPNSGASDRERPDRALRLARRVRRNHDRRDARPPSGGIPPSGNTAAP